MRIRLEINDIRFYVSYWEQDEQIDWEDTSFEYEDETNRLPYALYELFPPHIKHQFEVKVQEGIAAHKQSIKDEQRREF